MGLERLLDKIYQAIIQSDLSENLVVPILEDAIATVSFKLCMLADKPSLNEYEEEEYKDSLKDARALLRTLRYFSVDYYPEKDAEFKAYRKKYRGLTKDAKRRSSESDY